VNLAHRDPFGRRTPMIGDFEFVWYGWRRWRPQVAFYRIRPDNPMALVWRWQFFLGPLEIRRWVPLDAAPVGGEGTGR
jgi:hypothetical protein